MIKELLIQEYQELAVGSTSDDIARIRDIFKDLTLIYQAKFNRQLEPIYIITASDLYKASQFSLSSEHDDLDHLHLQIDQDFIYPVTRDYHGVNLTKDFGYISTQRPAGVLEQNPTPTQPRLKSAINQRPLTSPPPRRNLANTPVDTVT